MGLDCLKDLLTAGQVQREGCDCGNGDGELPAGRGCARWVAGVGGVFVVLSGCDLHNSATSSTKGASGYSVCAAGSWRAHPERLRRPVC